MVKESELRAGCIYRWDNMRDSRYEVCIGKIPLYFYAWVDLGVVPYDATLESFPLNRLSFNNPRSVQVYSGAFNNEASNEADVGLIDYANSNYTYVGKICEPTEQAIRTWLTQLKLSGYIIDIEEDVLSKATILGDWNNRKKLPCVQRFRKGSIYVREDLAYIRTRIPYHNNDKLWRYLGKQEDYYIWGWKYINDLWWTEPVQFEKPLENMVVFRQNAKGYQVVRK